MCQAPVRNERLDDAKVELPLRCADDHSPGRPLVDQLAQHGHGAGDELGIELRDVMIAMIVERMLQVSVRLEPGRVSENTCRRSPRLNPAVGHVAPAGSSYHSCACGTSIELAQLQRDRSTLHRSLHSA